MKQWIYNRFCGDPIKQRIYVVVLLTMFVAVLSLHFLVGRRALNPLIKEVTDRRVQTVALFASTIEDSEYPKKTMKSLRERFDVELKLVNQTKFLERRADNRNSGRQFTMDGHEITAFRYPKPSLFTSIQIRGKDKVLFVRFPVDIEKIKHRRRVDLAKIIAVLMMFSALISRWAFNPLYKATTAMNQIADGNLNHRVEENIGPAKDAFNQMADRVEQMIEGQQMLLAGVSHELRTPLARMRLQMALLESEEGTGSLNDEITEMDALVEMLLLSSQLQSGSFEIHSMPVALQDLVFEILAEMDLEERYLSLKLESTAPLIVDPLLLRRVIWNLCSNIAKYTPNDCTVVIASRNIEGFVEIQISDTGEGVSDEALVRLLDPFWRIDNSRSRPKSSSNSSTQPASQGGWGVGLSFVQHAMEAHKGSVVLSHNRPSGLTVTLRLPIATS